VFGALALLAVLLGLAAEHLGHSWEQEAWIPIADLAIGWAMVGSGIAAAWLRPAQPAGGRLILAGLLWFVGTFQPMDSTRGSALAFAFQGYFDPVLVLIALSFPGRWPARRGERAVLVLVAALYGASTLARLAARSPDLIGQDLIDPAAALPLVAWSDFARLGSIVLAGGFILRRWFGERPPGRRIVGPVIAAGAAAAFADAVLMYYPVGALGIAPPLDAPAAVVVPWASNVVRLLIPFAMFFGIMRQSATRSALAAAVAAVGISPATPDLRAALALALRDPNFQILAWDEGLGGYVDEAGIELGSALPRIAGRSVAPVAAGSRPLGAIVYDPSVDEDPAIVASAIAISRLVIENAAFAREIEHQLDEVRTSRSRIVEAGDAERRRIERDLHDGVQQRLIALAMYLRHAQAEASPHAPPAEALGYGADEVLGIVEDVREFASGIHPAVLAEAGLAAAIRGVADKSPVPVQLDLDIDTVGSPTTTATAFFVVSEALTNVSKHARATTAWVRARVDGGVLEVVVEDDGRGGAVVGNGLRGLSDRVAALGGTLDVRPRPDGGTAVMASIPLR